MENEPKHVLKEVFGHVLEDYAFLFSETLEQAASQRVPGPYLQASMRFQGPFHGALALLAPESFSREVAANVLGLDMEDEQVARSAPDAVKELLNITCGNLLTALAGDEPVFDLTIPEVRPLPENAWKSASAAAEPVGFLVEDTPVFLQLSLQGRGESSESKHHGLNP